MQNPISEEDIDAVLKQFQGTIEQIPPMFSAVKIGGKNSTNMQEKALKLSGRAARLRFTVSSGQHLLYLKMEKYHLDSPFYVQKERMSEP